MTINKLSPGALLPLGDGRGAEALRPRSEIKIED
jgi:hypothetical protein